MDHGTTFEFFTCIKDLLTIFNQNMSRDCFVVVLEPVVEHKLTSARKMITNSQIDAYNKAAYEKL